VKVWQPFADLVETTGPAPDGIDVTVWDGDAAVPADRDEVEAMVVPYLSSEEAIRLLPDLPRLKLLQTLTAGTDSLVGKVPSTVTVCNARGLHDTATAEQALTLTLAARNDVTAYERQRQQGIWHPIRQRPGLADASVVILGYGSIGKAIEARLIPFGCRITRVARSARDQDGVHVHGFDELATLARTTDILIIVAPLTEQTKGLVGADLLARLPDGALVVNVGRGAIVDTDALLAELTSRRLEAALDVTDPEPLPEGHPLWRAPGLVLLPHIGGYSRAFEPRARRLVADLLHRLASGAEPVNAVDGLGARA
jgi:phosphoglycerate dehydrogenase-like enzyme